MDWKAVASVAALLMAASVGLVACTETSRTVVEPPRIAGAEFEGTDSCETCHETLVRDFAGASHAVLRAAGDNAEFVGCESCHGPGSLHSESGGERGTIVAGQAAVCFQCHLDTRGDFSLPYSHPVTSGPLGLERASMSCADCHDPHRGDARAFGGAASFEQNEGCLECHVAQRGPFVYEHEALREGCVACHSPHGSVNQKMLTETNATLCTKCHFQEQPRAGVVMIGGQDHSFFLSKGTCFTAGCHEAVHGSQVSSTLEY
jgi:predicted CXXCH cytochrome family protein